MGEFRWGAIELMKEEKKTFVYLVLLKPAFFFFLMYIFKGYKSLQILSQLLYVVFLILVF